MEVHHGRPERGRQACHATSLGCRPLGRVPPGFVALNLDLDDVVVNEPPSRSQVDGAHELKDSGSPFNPFVGVWTHDDHTVTPHTAALELERLAGEILLPCDNGVGNNDVIGVDR